MTMRFEISIVELKDRLGLVYLASPYTANDIRQQSSNIIEAELATAKLLDYGIDTISPVVYTKAISKLTEKRTSYADWMALCMKILNKCDSIVVLKAPTWEDSNGIVVEIQKAQELGLPVFYLEILQDGYFLTTK